MALTLFATLPRAFYAEVGSGLESSWQVALHLAHDQGLVFGRDVIFTYGPLGFLATRLPFESIRWHLIASDLLLWSAIAYCLHDLFARAASRAGRLAIVGAVLAVDRPFYLHDLVIVHYVLLLFFLLKYREREQTRFLVLAGGISTLALFVKLNLGLTALACPLMLLGVQAVRTRRYAAHLAGAVALLAAPAAWSLVLAVDLPAYVVGSLHIVRGYNDAQFIPLTDDRVHLLVIALAIGLAFAVATVASRRVILADALLATIVLQVAGFLFVLFKQGFVRADDHVSIFFAYVTLPIGLVSLFAPRRYRKRLGLVVALSLVLSFGDAARSLRPTYFLDRTVAFAHYVATAATSGPALEALVVAERQKTLPAPVSRRLRAGTVDFVPWGASHAFHEGLAYDPRPVVQGYDAYDAYLDAANYRKLASESAPDWIAFRAESIDGRYAFADEARTKIGMLEHYEPSFLYDRWLLLGKRARVRATTRSIVAEGTLALGEDLLVPDSPSILYVSFKPRYSLAGRLRATLYQPPELRLRIHLEKGKTFDYKAIKPIAEAGFLANFVVRNVEQAERFFGGDLEQLPRVRSLRLYTRQPWGFEQVVEYSLESIRISQD